MKISYSWLKEYLPIDISAEEAARLLTGCGLEVESMSVYQPVKGGLEGLLIGKVLTCQRHPNADKLSLTTVDIGAESPLQIVCGAPNVAAGQKVVVAVVGATVHPTEGEPFEIRKSKIRGEVSDGMICAEDEIGLGHSHAGILVLPDSASVGMTAKEHFNIQTDIVFEIGLTPNRVDAASHIGTAIDLAALLQLKTTGQGKVAVTLPSNDSFSKDIDGKAIVVEVVDTTGCPRYSGVTIEGVRVGPSPDWLQHRLRAIGIGPINNVVDVTNFVLHECGHPLHAFDADKIAGGKVIVKRAVEGEKFITLDGVERILSADDLMICNQDKPMCIAGVFGGVHSGISDTTTTVFIESAYFDPGSVRKTGKRHGLKTDASFRFERGADPEMTIYALKRAALMIRMIAGGKISSEITDTYPVAVQPAVIDLDYRYLDRFVGAELQPERVLSILTSLGMSILKSGDQGCTVQVPTAKVDVTRPVDLVEEILRIHGYDEVPMPAKLVASLPVGASYEEKIREKTSAWLASNGFNEILTNSLTRNDYTEAKMDETVSLLNPLSQELSVLRTGLLHTALEAVQYNRNRRQDNLRFFEFGKCYGKSPNGYAESNRLIILLSGDVNDLSWKSPSRPVDFFLLKAHVEQLLTIAGLEKWDACPITGEEHFTGSGQLLMVGKHPVVLMGAIKRSVSRKFDISAPVYFADIDWDRLLQLTKGKSIRVREIPRFPHVRRDLSMVIDRSLEFARIETLAYNTERKLLREVVLFDVYEGEKVEQGKKSYAVSFVLQDEQQTLTDQQIDKTMDRLMRVFEKELGAVIRGGS